jgi:hypothetical protein
VEDAGDAEALVLGDHAEGVSSPCGLVTMTRSPTAAPTVSARSLPSTMGGNSDVAAQPDGAAVAVRADEPGEAVMSQQVLTVCAPRRE